MHLRTTIRHGIVAALVAAGTDAGSRVFSERVQAVDTTEYPCIEISLVREQQERIGFGNGRSDSVVSHTLELAVHYVQKATSGYYDLGDAALVSITNALTNAEIAGIKDIEEAGTLFDLEVEGERPLYTITQTYSITYITTQGNPATAL